MIEVIDLTRTKPSSEKRVSTKELSNIMPRRAAFWVLFQFQTGVSALLADLNRRCLTTLGHGGHSSSPYGVGVSSHMKFTFPVIIRSVASICPKVLDFLEIRSDQASSHLAKYVESSSITFSIPSIEIFGSKEIYLTLHAIEHLLRCCFDDNSGLNRYKRQSGALLVVHALYGEERILENLVAASMLVFIRSIEKDSGKGCEDNDSIGECRRFALSRLASIIKFWRALLVVLQQLGAPGSGGSVSREKGKINAYLQTFVDTEHHFDAVVAHRDAVFMLAKYLPQAIDGNSEGKDLPSLPSFIIKALFDFIGNLHAVLRDIVHGPASFIEVPTRRSGGRSRSDSISGMGAGGLELSGQQLFRRMDEIIGRHNRVYELVYGVGLVMVVMVFVVMVVIVVPVVPVVPVVSACVMLLLLHKALIPQAVSPRHPPWPDEPFRGGRTPSAAGDGNGL